jgi:membrane protease YdiL (CAAX protease family)
MRLYRVPVRESLRLGGVRPTVLVSALVLAPGATLVAAIAAALQGTIIEVPEAYEELMRQIVSMGGESGIAVALFVFAVVPGLCEELLFRGFVLRGLQTRFSPPAAILLSAVLFGVFHFDLYRLLPTTLLGVVLGWVAWRTDRLWPSVVIHVANNAVAVLAVNLPALQQVAWLQGTASPPVAVILGAAACGLLGFWALRHLGPEPDPVSGGV